MNESLRQRKTDDELKTNEMRRWRVETTPCDETCTDDPLTQLVVGFNPRVKQEETKNANEHSLPTAIFLFVFAISSTAMRNTNVTMDKRRRHPFFVRVKR